MLKKRTEVVENHRALVEAICAGRRKLAERLAREHGVSAASELFQALTKKPQKFSVREVGAKL
jgi:DNA-binding FadR family transcriptional regulator